MSSDDKAQDFEIEIAVSSPSKQQDVSKAAVKPRELSSKEKFSAYFTIAAAAFGLIR